MDETDFSAITDVVSGPLTCATEGTTVGTRVMRSVVSSTGTCSNETNLGTKISET